MLDPTVRASNIYSPVALAAVEEGFESTVGESQISEVGATGS